MSAPAIQAARVADDVPRCGDHVLHEPSGETWVVAYASASSNWLAWAGWPDGRALLSDCTTIYRCTDAEHVAAVKDWRRSAGGCTRKANVLHFYAAALERAREASP